MPRSKPTVLITGVTGNLGLRLLAQLGDFRAVGLDIHPPKADTGFADFIFEKIDLGREASCGRLVDLMNQHRPCAVVHLAFVIDPQQTGILDKERMWQINVAGTARVMEAISEHNRMGGAVQKLIVPSSVSVYGPETPGPVSEDFPLAAHTLTYAIHKQESDEVVQLRAATLGECRTYLLRPHIFVGHTMQNYLVGALRGTPLGAGRLGVWLRKRGTRLPMMLPSDPEFLQKRFQFVHVDDVARLMGFILEKKDSSAGLEVLNVAGRGEPVTLARAAEIAKAKLVKLPAKWLGPVILKWLWDLGISSIPAEALPYMIGSYTMDTARLQGFLGSEYRHIIRYSVEEALADSFVERSPAPVKVEHANVGG